MRKTEGWRDGEMERWRDGEMERWRNGEMERQRDGEMEAANYIDQWLAESWEEAHACYSSKIGIHDELEYKSRSYLRVFAGEGGS